LHRYQPFLIIFLSFFAIEGSEYAAEHHLSLFLFAFKGCQSIWFSEAYSLCRDLAACCVEVSDLFEAPKEKDLWTDFTDRLPQESDAV
jgi:hypothetical protein